MSPNEKASIHILAVCLVQAAAYLILLQFVVHYRAFTYSLMIMPLVLLGPIIFLRIRPVDKTPEIRRTTRRMNIVIYTMMFLWAVFLFTTQDVIWSIVLLFAGYFSIEFWKGKKKKGLEKKGNIFLGLDERDKLVGARAANITFSLLVVAFVLISFKVLEGKSYLDPIPAYVLVYGLYGGIWLLLFTNSLASLFYYRLGIGPETE